MHKPPAGAPGQGPKGCAQQLATSTALDVAPSSTAAGALGLWALGHPVISDPKPFRGSVCPEPGCPCQCRLPTGPSHQSQTAAFSVRAVARGSSHDDESAQVAPVPAHAKRVAPGRAGLALVYTASGGGARPAQEGCLSSCPALVASGSAGVALPSTWRFVPKGCTHSVANRASLCSRPLPVVPDGTADWGRPAPLPGWGRGPRGLCGGGHRPGKSRLQSRPAAPSWGGGSS